MTKVQLVPDALLSGTRVLELSAGVAGAYAGRMMRLLGADVLRWDAPVAADCPEQLQGLLEESLNEGKARLLYAEVAPVDGPAYDVVVVDCLHDDAYDGL